jgi:hypothetical protein
MKKLGQGRNDMHEIMNSNLGQMKDVNDYMKDLTEAQSKSGLLLTALAVVTVPYLTGQTLSVSSPPHASYQLFPNTTNSRNRASSQHLTTLATKIRKTSFGLYGLGSVSSLYSVFFCIRNTAAKETRRNPRCRMRAGLLPLKSRYLLRLMEQA